MITAAIVSLFAASILPFNTSINAPAAGGGGASYLVDQDFEGAGYDNSETWTEGGTGTLDEDYTGTVLDGAQSFRQATVTQNGTVYVSFAAQDEVWVYFLLRPVSVPGNTTIVTVQSGATEVANIIQLNSGLLRFQIPSPLTTVTTVGALSVGTTYHVWANYSKNTAGGKLSIGFSTDGTRPTSGNNYAATTGHARTAQISRFYIGDPVSGNVTRENIFDKIRIDDAQIGDNPP
jgi:hypothetical protein